MTDEFTPLGHRIYRRAQGDSTWHDEADPTTWGIAYSLGEQDAVEAGEPYAEYSPLDLNPYVVVRNLSPGITTPKGSLHLRLLRVANYSIRLPLDEPRVRTYTYAEPDAYGRVTEMVETRVERSTIRTEAQVLHEAFVTWDFDAGRLAKGERWPAWFNAQGSVRRRLGEIKRLRDKNLEQFRHLAEREEAKRVAEGLEKRGDPVAGVIRALLSQLEAEAPVEVDEDLQPAAAGGIGGVL